MANVLVIQLARIGDIVQTKRLIMSLERDHIVHLVLDKSLMDVASSVYPSAILHPILAHKSTLNLSEVFRVNTRAFSKIKSHDYAEVYNLNSSPLSLSISAMFPREQVVGYRFMGGESQRSPWCELAARWTRHRRNSPINLVDFWAFFNRDPISPDKVNPIATSFKPSSDSKLKIGIILSGRESRRSLPASILAHCVESLFIAYKGPEFVFIGGNSDIETGRKVLKALRPTTRSKVTDLSGKTTLKDLFEIIGDLNIVFTPDTGAMHIAAHLGVQVEAVFLSSAWAQETGPYGLGHKVWQATESCAPCLESTPCGKDHLLCLDPFKSREFHEALSNRADSATKLNSIVQMESSFDEIGINFVPQDWAIEADFPARSDLRLAIAERLGLAKNMQNHRIHNISNLSACIQEKDWITFKNNSID